MTKVNIGKVIYFHDTINWKIFLKDPLTTNNAIYCDSLILRSITILAKKVHLRCLTGSRMCLCGWIQHSSYKSNGFISLTASKDGVILINSFHLKFRSFNCLSINRPLSQLSKVSAQWRSQEYLFRKFSANYYQSICG